MVLCTLIGIGAAAAFGLAAGPRSGALYGVLAGFVVAPFVPLPSKPQ